MEDSEIVPWNFQHIFLDIEAKTNFIADVLSSFEQFPPELKLNCDDLFSLFSLVCENVPYNFIVFICECVDPSISSGTLNSHRIAFGNFLLALPCCILYPVYIHQILTLFKATDSLKMGLISKNSFLSIIRGAYTTVGGKGLEKYIDEMNQQKEYEEKHKYDQDFYVRPDPSQVPITVENDDIKVDLPEMKILDEVEEATDELEQASIQTLFFVLWQKNQYLLQCKSMIHENSVRHESSRREEYHSQLSIPVESDEFLPKSRNTPEEGIQEKELDDHNQFNDEKKDNNDQNQFNDEKKDNNDENKDNHEKKDNNEDKDNNEVKDNNEAKDNNKAKGNNENKEDTITKDQSTNPPSLNVNFAISLTRKDTPSDASYNSPAYDEEELVEADEEYQPRHSML